MCVCVYAVVHYMRFKQSKESLDWHDAKQTTRNRTDEKQNEAKNTNIDDAYDSDGFHEKRGFPVYNNTSIECGEIRISYQKQSLNR